MSYADGFAAGESDAYTDRKAGRSTHRQPRPVRSEAQRGYEDGYCCRSAAWDKVDTMGRPIGLVPPNAAVTGRQRDDQ